MSEPRAAYTVDLPPDLNLAILTILSFHTSSRNPIPRVRLCSALKGFNISDRHIRERIKQLRRSGHLIGSISTSSWHRLLPQTGGAERNGVKLNPDSSFGAKDAGTSSGYYLITNPADLQDFLSREYLAKISDMRQTVEAMSKSASQRWGLDSIQKKLF